MSERIAPRSVPIPALMQHLLRDRRGYPIPVTVLKDTEGRPHFAVNDERERQRVILAGLCSICDKKLWRGRWLVGGAVAAFHEHGAFIDPPMHYECLEYALKVCPYLAAPSYAGSVGERTIDPSKLPGHIIKVNMTPTDLPRRPPLFVVGMVVEVKLVWESGRAWWVRALRPGKPYRQVQYWRHGTRLDDIEGARLAQEDYAAQLPKLKP